MNRQTIAALNRINRRFYQLQSEDFSRTRQNSWPGWARVVAVFQERSRSAGAERRASILDAGCGNGRFRDYAASRIRGRIRYVGVDASVPLLVEARRSAVGSTPLATALVATDLATDGSLGCLRASGFDLAVVFGLLHHIPSRQARLRLLTDLSSCLRPNGLMAVSFWQFGEHHRYLRRAISWKEYNRQAEERIEISELEEGDMVLAWGELLPGDMPSLGSAVRFCHFTNATEAEELVGSLPMEVITGFSSDGEGGHQNLYFLLEKPR
jgi:tRNA (uracil-5-)-methyltransferase TRM9